MAFQSEMQRAYRRNATRRWNVKTGATRAGKTYGDYFLIPKRLLDGRGRDGLNVILGNTRGTIQRNILDPMRDIWGPELVGRCEATARPSCSASAPTAWARDNARHDGPHSAA